MGRGRYGGTGRAMPGAVRAEVVARVRRGERWKRVAADVGVSKRTVARVMADAGGMQPRWKDRNPRQLSLAEREEISRRLEGGDSFRVIAATLGRHHGTIAREVNVNGGRQGYRAWRADRRACVLARRPKQTVFERSLRLREFVEAKLWLRWSPQQIAARLVAEFPDEPEMRVSHETIYQSLFVQGRGGLRKELSACLRSGRTRRRPRPRAKGSVNQGPIADMVMISERPAEVEDRAVPGHWEGDLIIGKGGQSAVGTLVERTSRFVMLMALPDGRRAEQVRDALTARVQQLPQRLRKSITWDQGVEMAQHVRFTVDSGVQVYFCDPHAPWQRGSNENTNGLIRQYLPKGTDLSHHSQAELDAIADELNGRPRQTLGWATPSERLQQLLAAA